MDMDRQGKWHRLKGIFLLLLLLLLIACLFTYVYFVHDQLFNGPKALGGWPTKIQISTRQSKHCGFCIYIFDNYFDQSKSMVRLVRAEKMVLSGLVFARKIARMILIQDYRV